MYLKETIDSFASNANILKLLKKDAQFNHHCIEEMVSKGTELIYNRDREYFYLIEQGYVKYEYDGQLGQRFHFLFGPGSFPFLPIYEDDVPNISKVEILADVRWWRVEFSFFKKVMRVEDPRNYILLAYMARTRRELYAITIQDRLNSQDRIYFSLLSLIDLGFRQKNNSVELPIFLTYKRLAEFSNTSKGYTSKVLSELRAKKILISSKKPWVITDVEELRRLLGADQLPQLS
ncbi:Crp/Fnr family transcriptional regulator [Listeria booriae]|uniref:Crp/Fnr family transcriptional regulator n=1 Tax=Listeria booriae TaxID=1552123 RepID=UPI001623210F|nr:Crp/Fnr family transcriptional regulator [Listeria booriae]MBC1984941.1 Crp/Fnr family transcriptional regulator [Listeria booriae]MBC2048777.1 Crp/Fnr family transcriptional regulator [Listeria booriae]